MLLNSNLICKLLYILVDSFSIFVLASSWEVLKSSNDFKEEWCLVAGSNILYTIGDKLKEIDTEHRGNHVMNPPDELHTLLLGALKYCIVWCFDCL